MSNKHVVSFTIQEYVQDQCFGDPDEAADSIVEYWPDHKGPDDTDTDTIQCDSITYSPDGKEIIFTFSYDETEEEEDEDFDEESDD